MMEVEKKTCWETNIFQTKLPIYDDLIDFLIEDSKTNPGQKKSNHGGWQTLPDLYQNPITKKLREKIREMVIKIFPMSILPTMSTNVSFIQMWGAINRPGNSNAVHCHGGSCDMTFGYYLQVPEKSGELCLRDPRVGCLQSYFWTQLDYEVRAFLPAPGTLLMMPSYIDHYVEPNESNEDRIMIAGDLRIWGE